MTDSTKPTLLVVDGHSLAFRAFFALPVDTFVTTDGQHTNGIHGFLSMFINLLRDENPTHVAVAFDKGNETFRHREYDAYKGTRNETPPEFKGQVPLLQDALRAMNVTVLEDAEYEADDILATLAARGEGAGWRVLVCSGDRDSIQLVDDRVTLLYPSVQGVSKLKRYDPAAVMERYGVPPHMYPDVAALVGETSDNLPGVPKVGEKTAVKWLNQYGSLDELLARADEVKGVVGQNLRDHLDDVKRNRHLNRLLPDVELNVELEQLERRPFDTQALRDVFSRLEFRSLLGRVLALDETAEEVEEEKVELPTPRVMEAAELRAWLGRATGEVGVTIQLEQGAAQRIGFAHGDDLVETGWSETVALALGGWFASDAQKVFSDAKPQVKALARAGVRLGGLAYDVIIAGWLNRPSFPDKTLANLVDTYLQEKLPEADPTQLVPETDGASPAQRSWFTLRVASALRAALPERVAEVLTDIEMPTLLALADMELAGVAVSHAKLSAFSTELGERAASIEQEAYDTIGHEVNLGSPKQLQEVLFVELELPKTRKTKTGYTTDAAALAELQEKADHPFLAMLLTYREATKLKQIIDALDAAIDGTGRVHT
ncbi:MAG: DNA polymerase, partial [Microbacterium sp.]